MCWNLRNKQYCIRNQQLTKDEYEREMKKFNLRSWKALDELQKEFDQHVSRDAYHKPNFNVNCEASTGNYLTQCKKCDQCYFLETSEDCAYVYRGLVNKDSYDSTGIWKVELAYETVNFTQGYLAKFIIYCTNCSESEYLDNCVDCSMCFGCVGLRKKKYCILNKQYSEADYHKQVAKIKDDMRRRGEYGQFFPYAMAYTGYNLTLGGMVIEQTEEEIKKLGGRWEELEKPDLTGLNIYPATDDINDVSDDVTQKALVCQETGRAYKITKIELAFLKKHQIPLPRLYPDVRTIKRFKKLAPPIARPAKCTICSKDITVYYPESWGYQKLTCEEDYLKLVV